MDIMNVVIPSVRPTMRPSILIGGGVCDGLHKMRLDGRDNVGLTYPAIVSAQGGAKGANGVMKMTASKPSRNTVEKVSQKKYGTIPHTFFSPLAMTASPSRV